MTVTDRLEGWKAIAAHLGVTERTARMREKMGGIRVVRERPWPCARKAFVAATPDMLRPPTDVLQ